MAVHATGIAVLLHTLRRRYPNPADALLADHSAAGRHDWWLVLLHLTEILVWGLFYLWWECLPDAEASVYFSGVTYTTMGYGDLVLAKPWRVLAPIEGLTGILMCGLSTGVFFAVVNHIYQAVHAPTRWPPHWQGKEI